MKTLDLKSAFKYPFNRAKGMLNMFWILLPFVGWFALGGYGIRVIKEFSKGKFKKLPIFKFSSDLKLGFFMFLKSLPFIIAYTVILLVISLINPWVEGTINLLLGLFVVPILTINFFNKETVESFFEFKILKHVFNNLGDYMTTILKSLLLGLIFLLMFIVLVGIPANAFTKNIFLADFYRRRVK
ncbi:hypothetical protein COV16_04010 [Candidatus Woesearchaeota archaeon CG10_big_fil_rev_8_21_14_0_10_34_8]|jgi:hypothetical protein|nr:MAG: hypothetical protein COV16_04010 [Candidatus Woesearchaeota archaeon CG10_big_fil_rev_8_21_14_0_10_34_8]